MFVFLCAEGEGALNHSNSPYLFGHAKKTKAPSATAVLLICSQAISKDRRDVSLFQMISLWLISGVLVCPSFIVHGIGVVKQASRV